MRKIQWIAAGALACLFAMPCSQAQAQEAKPPVNPKSAASGTTGRGSTSSYDRVLLRPALLTAKAPATYQVKFITTKGDFVITVTRAWAPLGADRFYNLVRHHFYDNT